MERQIRRMGIVLAGLFAILFLQINNIQVLQASKLSNSTSNPRVALRLYNQTRGAIQTSDGTVIADSVASHDRYNFLRQYPQGPLYAEITGYFSLVYGTWGVENTYNKYLISHQNPVKNLSDLVTSNNGPDDLTLTVNSAMQQAAATALKGNVGAVVALNPKTGAILALYGNPTYDPNALASHNVNDVLKAWKANLANPSNPMLDRAYRRSYAPGSTFKVITSSAVYDHDPQLATKVYPQLSQLTLPNTNKTLSNFAHEVCGGTLPTLMAVSCDSGFGQIGLDLGAANLVSEAEAFGFNKTPPFDLPGAAISSIPSAASFAQNLPGVAYSAIGQEDVQATALGMALVTSAIADGGTIMTPHVMSEIRDTQGNLIEAYNPHPWLTATSSATASAVSSLMVGVVQGGTASNIAIPGITLGAKTGTAQTQVGAGSNNWLEAFGPAENPSIVVVATVPAQSGLPIDTTGSQIAGPIVKAMLEAAIQQGLLK